MPTTLISTIRPVMFSSELDVVQMSTTESPVTVAVTNGADDPVFETELYPLASGSLTLFDVGKLVEDALGKNCSGTFKITANGSTVCSMRVVKSAVTLSLNAAKWTEQRFLTSMTGERDTDMSRFETISCFNPDGDECAVEAVYLKEDGTLSRMVTVQIPPAEQSGDVWVFNASPAAFAAPERGKLVRLRFAVGARTQSFRVLLDPPPSCRGFVFRNNFGCWETLYCSGDISSDPQFSRQTAMINGRFEAYEVAETDRVTASTGVMRFGSERLVRDFARSKQAYLLEKDGSRGERVVVTECSVKDSNADDFNPQFSFTYRLAKSGASDLDGFKIFDDTFDDTYE